MVENTQTLASVRRMARDRIKRTLTDRLISRWFPGRFDAGGPFDTNYSHESLPNAARNARRSASIDYLWDRLECAGLVTLEYEPDHDYGYEYLAGDCFDESNADSVPGGMRTIKAQEEAFKRKIESDGVWGLVGRYRLSEDDPWSNGDSVWGFVGTDDTGYETDIKAETIGALVDALRDRCPTCRRKR